jgi:hypothetical protein
MRAGLLESQLPLRGVSQLSKAVCPVEVSWAEDLAASQAEARLQASRRTADSCAGTVTPIPEPLASELTSVCQAKLLGLVSNPWECTCGGGEAQGADGKHGHMVDFLLCDSGFAGTADSGMGSTF